ncbi:MAG: hypothetical protein Q4D36_04770 [Bacteroidales bacterium]|nr:hypothetical protein [Bacteroidales bacterium]
MKRNLLYVLALATAMVACTDDYTDWADPIQTPQEEAKSVALSVTAASAIDYAEVAEETERVKVFTPSVAADETPSEVIYKVTVSPKDGEGSVVLSAESDGTVSAEDLKNAVASFYGKAPEARVLNLVVDASVVINGQAIKVTASTVELTVTLAAANIGSGEFIYIPGNHQGWNTETAGALRAPDFDGIYTGFCYLDGGFKFTFARDWTSGEYNAGDFPLKDETLGSDSDNNITASVPNFYYIEADILAGELKLTATSVWSIVGAATGDDTWGTDIDMTWDATDESWSVTADLVPGEFKFRADHDWGVDLGGASFDNLSKGGANLNITEEGTYEVKVYMTRCSSDNIYCTVTKK